jgi:hypothetical protein
MKHSFPSDVSTQDLQHLLGGLTNARLTQLEQSGIIKRTKHGRYTTDSIPSFIEFQRRAGGGSEELQEARLDLLLQKITMGKLDLEERQGKLVPVEIVRQTWISIVAMVRGRFLSIPSKLAPRLLGKHNPSEVETILRAEVYDVLTDLAENVEIKVERKKGGSSIQPEA